MTTDKLLKDLQAVTADLHRVNPWIGLFRFGLIGAVFLTLVAIAWSVQNPWMFGGVTAIAGFWYAFWLVCTHDMVHGALTGWGWFDRPLARLISYPMLWPLGLYAELHRLHHAWNGIDLRDPERVQWTWEEYQAAHPLLRWYVRHQWTIDIFILGGVGLILKTWIHALQLRHSVPRIHRQMVVDLSGMVLMQSLLLTLALLHGRAMQYVVFWFILERVIGIVMQTRDHLEHYALWGKTVGHQVTQLYASRNLHALQLTGWLMGGLNHHAVHHAFPEIPFNALPEAFQRIQAVLKQHGLPPMSVEPGYLEAAFYFSQNPSLIGQTKSMYVGGRDRMILIG